MSFSCYYIRQLGCTMKPKKKSTIVNKKCTKKINTNKPLHFVDKTIVTTKERTHNTIEDPVQIKDHRLLIHTPRIMTSRVSSHQKQEAFNYSPFSSPGGSSFSPKCRKAISPMVVKQEKQKKPSKQKNLIRAEKVSKTSQQKRYTKPKPKTAKEQCNLTYQKFVLKKLDEKKITELSQESQVSIRKFNKLHIAAKVKNIKESNKHLRIKELKQKIVEKYTKELPSLKTFQLKFYCSIVLIQRLWRQKRIKNFISEFISPRSNPDCNITTQIPREINVSKLETTGTSQEQTLQLIKKYHNISSIFEKKCQLNQREVYSTQIETDRKNCPSFQLKDLQLSAELAPQKQKKMIRFVDCLRDIKFTKPIPNQSKKYSKTNVFNLQESLSQKCLMQTFYQKIFKNSPTKMNNFQVFNFKKEQKNLERSIQLINNIKSPEKVELVEIQQRFQTELQSQQVVVNQNIQAFEVKEAVQKMDTGVGTSPIQQQQKSKQIKSLKELNILSEDIIFLVLNQFCEEFHAFTSRKILRKKKKNSLPGLKVTLSSIEQYLIGLTSYMMQKYESQVVRRFNVISPLSFLKIHHEYDEQQQEQYQEEEEQMNMPIIPNSLFYQYQLIYQSQKFQIREEDKKFSNFLQSLIKIHNLLLSNCLSQILQKTRIERVVLPWDRKFDASRHKNNKIEKKAFESQLNKIIKSICSGAFTRVGQFHKRLDEPVEQQKLLRSISLEYKQQGNEWSAQYEYLELRMDLTKHVEEVILEEVMQDIMIFF